MKAATLLLLIVLLASGAVFAKEEADTSMATAPQAPTATFYTSIDEAAQATHLPWYNFWDDPEPIVVEFYTDW